MRNWENYLWQTKAAVFTIFGLNKSKILINISSGISMLMFYYNLKLKLMELTI